MASAHNITAVTTGHIYTGTNTYSGGIIHSVKSVTAQLALTLDSTDSGKVIAIDASAEQNMTITLPATADSSGVSYDFILAADSNAASQVLITSDTNIVGAVSLWATGVESVIASGASRGFGNSSSAGSRIHIVCDGSRWIILKATSDVALVTAIA